MEYISTRANHQPVSAGEAIRLGMVPGGGLFVPQSFPAYQPAAGQGANWSYDQLARDILGLYLTDYDPAALAAMVDAAYYGGQFDAGIAPVVPVGENAILELWHGPTAAFKDMALQLTPRLLTAAVAQSGQEQETVILVATSGDTGKAALEGFKNVPGIKIIVFYPAQGVSPIQELQMRVTDGDNTYVAAVEGNFDDCQTAVKQLFADAALEAKLAAAGKRFSSANSINWGRLLPQIVYYYYGYGQMVSQGLVEPGRPIDVVVPTGNFGNILAAYYAQRMGLPLGRLVCASNRNNVLTEAIASGHYNSRRPFYKTTSPSMDILISSNFERFLFEMLDRDGQACAGLYQQLAATGAFACPQAQARWEGLLWGGCASEEEGAAAIAQTWKQHHYLLDPHTAVAVAVAQQYRQQQEAAPLLIVSTASPFKFPRAALSALGADTSGPEGALCDRLSQVTGWPVHPALQGVEQKPLRHHARIPREGIGAYVEEVLGLR